MGKGSHDAKPIGDLKKQGTYRKDRHGNRLEGAIKTVETPPEPPSHFGERHRNTWARVCREVFELGILAKPDVYILEMFVSYWLLWQDAQAEVQKSGVTIVDEDSGKLIKNPAVSVMADAAKTVKEIAGLIGFSPRARMGIKTEAKESVDPFASFLTNN